MTSDRVQEIVLGTALIAFISAIAFILASCADINPVVQLPPTGIALETGLQQFGCTCEIQPANISDLIITNRIGQLGVIQ
jgi:hypothetical protein